MNEEKSMFDVCEVGNLVLTRKALCVVKIDSDAAKNLLRINKNNRILRRRAVEYLKLQIKTGEWRDDHPQPIVFSSAGRLIDGQHRLFAIAESGLDQNNAVYSRVETGADDTVREYLDTGVPRTLDDRVSLVDDHRQNKIIAQVCNYYFNNVKYATVRKATPEQAKEFFLLHSDALLFVAKNKKNDKGTGSVAVAYAAMEYFEKDKEKAECFYQALNIPDSDIQQARMLRDWLLRSVIAISGGSGRSELYTRAVGCMRAHREGREIKMVRAAQW